MMTAQLGLSSMADVCVSRFHLRPVVPTDTYENLPPSLPPYPLPTSLPTYLPTHLQVPPQSRGGG